MELKNNITGGKGFNPVRHVTGRSKKALSNRATYIAQKALIRGMKFLVFVLQTISRLGAIVFIVSVIIIAIVAFILIACLSSILVVMDNGELTFTVGELNSSKNKKTAATKTVDIDGWLNACQTVWTYNKKAGYSYKQQDMKDKEYGNIRPDCNGYVWQCLSEYGSVKKPNEGRVPSTSDMASSCKSLKDWEVISWSDSAKLEKGDILLKPGEHSCIYAGNETYYNNGQSGSSFPDRDGVTKKGSYNFWKNKMGSGCYIIRLKATLDSVSSADTNKIKKMSDSETWKLMSGGKFKSYDEANKAYAKDPKGQTKFWTDLTTKVSVPCWKWNDNNDLSKGKKSSTTTITVNKHLAGFFKDFMTDLYNLPEKYVIHSVGGFCVRPKNNGTGTTALSAHSFGGTLDINPSIYGMGSAAVENAINKNKPSNGINCGHPFNSAKGLKGWSEACCCVFNSDWFKLSQDYRLNWGGLWSASYTDPMHFSIVGDGTRESIPKAPKTEGQSPSKNKH